MSVAWLRGVFPPIPTAFGPDGALRPPPAPFFDYLRDGELDGVVALGSNGEAAQLTEAERLDWIRSVRTALPPPLRLIDLKRESLAIVRKGGVVFHHSETLHTSHRNESDRDRDLSTGDLGSRQAEETSGRDRGCWTADLAKAAVDTEGAGTRLWADKEAYQRVAERVPLGKRMATPADVVGPVLFLASDDAAFVTGAEIIVDGGERLRQLLA